MSTFFNKKVLLHSEEACKLYEQVSSLPIVDYHCHLNPAMIAEDAAFGDIGEFWLSGDHYKWRAMRMCGVDERYITGDASFHDKFIKYAEILPQLIGNPLYYWTHMELSQIFDIHEPLCAESAERIYEEASEKLSSLSVHKLLHLFGVEIICTTDDPVDSLCHHGKHGGVTVLPTFRPDAVYALTDAYLDKLSAASGVAIQSLDDLLRALTLRLDYFVEHGCVISDHGFDRFPTRFATHEEACALFNKRQALSDEEKEAMFGYLLVFLMKEYKKRSMTMQIHFAVTRNVNPDCFKQIGVDSGFDVISSAPDSKDLAAFLSQLSDADRPNIVLYTLNDATLSSLCCVSGAFRNVRMGAAWWFNDTLLGIKRNLQTVGEYAALGTNLGMLTDSRSFSSYSRFDFFRRILCDHVGEMVRTGEYDEKNALTLVRNICYNNAKEMITK